MTPENEIPIEEDHAEGSMILRDYQTPERYIGSHVTTTGIPEVPAILTWEDFQLGVHGIGRLRGAMIWIAGDWLNRGEDLFGERYAQVVEATGYDEKMVSLAQALCRAYPYAARHPKLSWTHHQVVMALPPEDRENWLRQAEEANPYWTRNELRDHVRESQGREKKGRGRPATSDKPENIKRRARQRQKKIEMTPEAFERLMNDELAPDIESAMRKAVIFVKSAEGVIGDLKTDNKPVAHSRFEKLAKIIHEFRDEIAPLEEALEKAEADAQAVADYQPPEAKPKKERKAKKAKKAKKAAASNGAKPEPEPQPEAVPEPEAKA